MIMRRRPQRKRPTEDNKKKRVVVVVGNLRKNKKDIDYTQGGTFVPLFFM